MKALWRSPTLRSAVIYGVSGFGFVGANLVLARLLPTTEYGLFTLVIALVNVGFALATAGLDGVVNRRHLQAGSWLLRRTLGAALVVGVGVTVISWAAYGLTLPMLLVVLVSTVAGGVMTVAAAKFQSEQRFGISLALGQSPNLVILVAAVVVAFSTSRGAFLPLLISALGFVAAAALGWWMLFRERESRPPSEVGFSWGEAFSFAGVSAAGLLLIQLDRLIIPHVLSVHDLATFGVLAAIAGSLFRVLAMGVGYTLVPRLRVAPGVVERRLLVAHEAKLVSLTILVGSAIIWFVTPLVEQWFLAGKYHLTAALVLATLVSGIAKVANSFTRSIVSALANPVELSLLNWLGWASVGLGVVGGIVGARWGLAGLIYGVTVGWCTRALAALLLAVRHLRLPPAVPVKAR